MAYFKNLERAAEWLASNQNPDNGWGLTPNQASSLVNTAEALFVLNKSKANYSSKILNGVNYLCNNWKVHLDERGNKVRFIAFPLFVLNNIKDSICLDIEKDIEEMKCWLLNARNDDGGWGAMQENASDIYSTFIAIQAIHDLSVTEAIKNQARIWVWGNFGERGWSFEPQGAPSASATSYAVLTLNLLNEDYNPKLRLAESFLLQTDHWENEEANYAGTLWKHCTHSNVICSLSTLGQDIFSSTIAQAVRYSNQHIHQSGGWMETIDGKDNRTVRSQYWAVYYSEILISEFDPSKYILRVDAERTETTLKAPDFQHFYIKTNLATVLPTPIFKAIVHILFFIGVVCGLELIKPMQFNISDYYRYIGFCFIALAFILMGKRPKVFTRSFHVTAILVALLGGLNLFLGVTINDVFDVVQASLRGLGKYLIKIK